MSMAAAGPFLEPVPEEVPNYHTTIKHPMDLGTIRARLAGSSGAAGSSHAIGSGGGGGGSSAAGGYASLGEVRADVALIWANCRLFNEDGSPFVKAASKLETAFEREWRKAGLLSE